MKSKLTMMALFLFSAFALLIGQNALAVDVASIPVKKGDEPNAALFRQLDDLRSQNALLAEALRNAELKNKISTAGYPSGQIGSPVAAGAGLPGAALPGVFAPQSAQVLMVSGMGNNLTALISLPNGSRVNARVGGTISGMGVVKSISINEVIVGNKSQSSSLPFASDSSGGIANTSGGTNNSVGPLMPPVPQVMLPGGAR